MVSSATSDVVVLEGEEWLTVAEIGRRVHLSRNTILALIYDGKLPAKTLCRGAWHVKSADLARWLATPDNVRQR